MELWKKCVLFYLGGGTYMGLEFAWRGRSHGSMFLAGGGCFLLIGKLSKRLSLPARAAAGAGIITGIELLTGLLFNSHHQVWDYRALPLNFKGQFCLPFTALWAPLSLVAGWLYTAAEKQLPGKQIRRA